MNKFFPLPILIPGVILTVFLTLAYFTSAHAQQHDSPASARKLDADHPISLMLPAYATEYFYFSLPNIGDSIPAVTLSDSSEIHIQLYDSREVSLKYTISSSHVITFHDSLSAGERYFLKLSNQSFQDKKLKLTLRYTEKAKKAAGTKNPVKAKTSAKTSTRSKISTKPMASVKASTKPMASVKASAKPMASVKASAKPMASVKASAKPMASAKASTKPKNSDKAAKTIHATNIPAIHTPKAITTPTQIPKISSKPITTDPISKSDFLLSTHFLRTKAGTSLAIAEALNLSEESSSLSYQCIFSDRISIQNGILYFRSPGIAVIEIAGEHFKSSCTICIQQH